MMVTRALVHCIKADFAENGGKLIRYLKWGHRVTNVISLEEMRG